MPILTVRTFINSVSPFKLLAEFISPCVGVFPCFVSYLSVRAFGPFNFFHRVSSVIEECSPLSASQFTIGHKQQGAERQSFNDNPAFCLFLMQRLNLFSMFRLFRLGFCTIRFLHIWTRYIYHTIPFRRHCTQHFVRLFCRLSQNCL